MLSRFRKLNNLIMKNIGLVVLIIVFGACRIKPSDQNVKSDQIESFSLMSFNVLYSTSVESTLKTIRETDADIVGLQEANEQRIKECADSLGYYYLSFRKTSSNLSNNDTGILSRYPIVKEMGEGVIIELPGGEKIAFFSVHLSPYPYEPYDIRDNKLPTQEEVVSSAAKNRLPEISPVLAVVDSLQQGGMPVFLSGDFNEPSHLDWTKQAADNDMHFAMQVDWPVSKAILEVGLEDAWRNVHSDVLEQNGITWTTNKSENEVYDRIDFVYHNLQGKWITKSVARVGRMDNDGDIKIGGYESDHFAVLSYYSTIK